jgi:hypothetical protein
MDADPENPNICYCCDLINSSMFLHGVLGIKLAGRLAYQDFSIKAIEEIGGYYALIDLID